VTRRVLVIDDDDAIREVVALSLSAIGGHEVQQAATGEQGLAAADAAPPDAILLDVMMPGLDGPSTLARLRARERTGSVPVVFLTAKVLRSERERLERLGADGVIDKPFDPMTLAAQLEAVLGWQHAGS
jgi:CheY-like chemotaxis protein